MPELYIINMPIEATAIEIVETSEIFHIQEAYLFFRPTEIDGVTYAKLETALFEKEHIPMELRPAIGYHAYETGHAYGYHEVWLHLNDLVDALSKPLKEFEARVKRMAKDY